MRLASLVTVVASCVFAALAGATAQPIESGRIMVGRGVRGVTLGMTRAQVVARLGRPISQNAIGYMEYSRKHLFDVYVRRGTPKWTDLISAAGPGFCLSGGICSLTEGSLKRLVGRFGARLDVELYPEDADAPDYVIRSRFQGRPVNTAFSARTWADRPGLHRVRRSRRAGVPGPPARRTPECCRSEETSKPLSAPRILRPHRRRRHVRRSTVPRAAGRASVPALESGGENVCGTYRLCHFGVAGAEWSVAVFWPPHSGADGAGAWFRKGSGGWRAYRQLIVPRRLAGLFRSFGCPL